MIYRAFSAKALNQRSFLLKSGGVTCTKILVNYLCYRGFVSRIHNERIFCYEHFIDAVCPKEILTTLLRAWLNNEDKFLFYTWGNWFPILRGQKQKVAPPATLCKRN
jgi:hypothetical protein